VTLEPIVSWLASRGYDRFQSEGVKVGGWPVQFLPVATPLDEEALREARQIELGASADEEAVTTRILSAEHLMATALKVGRPKDDLRLVQLLQSQAFDHARLRHIIETHGLSDRWKEFCTRMCVRDPLVEREPGGASA
jgi:hypothetical protein